MGAHVLFLHVVPAYQRRLVASYKKQLGWEDEHAEGPVNTGPPNQINQAKDDQNRKPVFSLLAFVTSVVTAGMSLYVYTGAPSGFEGFMPMVIGAVFGLLGVPVAIAFCIVGLIREKKYLWLNLISIVICSAMLLWLLNLN